MKNPKQILNWIRNLKQKLTHDNLWDISFGAALACVGLWLYLNVIDMDKLIIIVIPAILSFWNELLNLWQGQKGIKFFEIGLRCFIATVIYCII